MFTRTITDPVWISQSDPCAGQRSRAAEWTEPLTQEEENMRREAIWGQFKPSNSETGLMFRVHEPWSRVRRSRLSTRNEPKETSGSFSVKDIKTGTPHSSLLDVINLWASRLGTIRVSPTNSPRPPCSLRSAQPSLTFLKQGNPRPDELRREQEFLRIVTHLSEKLEGGRRQREKHLESRSGALEETRRTENTVIIF